MQRICGSLASERLGASVLGLARQCAQERGLAHSCKEGAGHLVVQIGGLHVAESSDGRHRLVLDGDGLDLRELCERHRVEPRGSRAATLVELLARVGTPLLAQLRGGFALAWVELGTGTARLARDRFGTRPLLLRREAGALLFGSEAGLLPGGTPSLDAPSVAAFLSYGAPLGQRALPANTIHLEPGTLLEVDLASAAAYERSFAQWHVPEVDPGQQPQRELERELAERLQVAVQRALGGAQKVGLALSGGLNSTIVGALAQRVCSPTAYHVSFGSRIRDERAAAERAALHVGMPLRDVVLDDEDFLTYWREASLASEGPVGSGEEIGLRALAETAAGSEERILTGHGASELFGGHAVLLHAAEDQAVLQALGEEPQLAKEPTLARFAARARRVYGRKPPIAARDFFEEQYAEVPSGLRDSILEPGFLALAGGQESIAAPLLAAFDQAAGRDSQSRYLFCLRSVHAPRLAGVVARSVGDAALPWSAPFFDEELATFAECLPIDKLLRWRSEIERRAAASECAPDVAGRYDEDRWLLRKVFQAHLPKRGCPKRHVPMQVPVQEWLMDKGPVRDFLHDVLLGDATRERGLFSRSALERLLAEIENETTCGARIPLLFRATSLELWCRSNADRVVEPLLVGCADSKLA